MLPVPLWGRVVLIGRLSHSQFSFSTRVSVLAILAFCYHFKVKARVLDSPDGYGTVHIQQCVIGDNTAVKADAKLYLHLELTIIETFQIVLCNTHVTVQFCHV